MHSSLCRVARELRAAGAATHVAMKVIEPFVAELALITDDVIVDATEINYTLHSVTSAHARESILVL